MKEMNNTLPKYTDTVIIGAGLGGLAMGIGMQKKGLNDYIIIEKSTGNVTAVAWRLRNRTRLTLLIEPRSNVMNSSPCTDGASLDQKVDGSPSIALSGLLFALIWLEAASYVTANGVKAVDGITNKSACDGGVSSMSNDNQADHALVGAKVLTRQRYCFGSGNAVPGVNGGADTFVSMASPPSVKFSTSMS